MKQVKNKVSALIYKEPYRVIGIVIAVLVFLSFSIGIVIRVGNSLMKSDTGVIQNQSVDGLSFENANIQVENGISKYTVEVKNDLKESMELKTIEIVLKDEKGEELTRLIGYIGNSLESGESKVLEASIDEELPIVPQVEYHIHK